LDTREPATAATSEIVQAGADPSVRREQSGDAPPLRILSVTAGYRVQPIIFDISVDIRPGITAIIGPNGAGKSTLFKAVFGLARVFKGDVIVDGQHIRMGPRDLVRHGVAYVPQARNVFPSLSVRENLEIGTYVRSNGRAFDRVFTLFPDLAVVQHKHAGKLSGGQRNMLAVGRALMSDPKVILLDEATGGLSPLLSQKLWGHLVTLASTGVAVGAVEQNVNMALNFAERVYLLASGRNLLSGTPRELLDRPDFASTFLEGSDKVPPTP
jgi:branched-chain amino acid transport system ATP-binding protein